MFSELNWLGAVLLALGVLVVGVPALWMIRRSVRDRAIARDPFGARRRRSGSRFRRVHRKGDRP
jgi:hypothetical protein